MTDAEFWASWRLWMAVATAIILVVAVLLILIVVTAKSIYAHAVRLNAAAVAIQQQTNPIWELQTSNEVATGLLETVQDIEHKATTLAGALESHAGAPGRS